MAKVITITARTTFSAATRNITKTATNLTWAILAEAIKKQ